MNRFPRLKTQLAASVLLLTATACSAGTIELGGPSALGLGEGAIAITVLNDGNVALSNLRILTSESDSIPLIGSLTPGQRSAEYRVNEAHDYPLIRATVRGQSVIAHPVEGFTGWNPELPDGKYVLQVRFNETHQMLEPRMVPVP